MVGIVKICQWKVFKNMTTIICDFMGDSYQENIVERLCQLNSKKFSHIISHRIPKKSSPLSNFGD